MKYAFFPGCTAFYRLPGYELSTRRVADALGIELLDLEGVNCCGLPINVVDHLTSITLSARVLCLAEEAGLDVVTICNGCNSMLATVNAKLKEDRNLRERINGILKQVDLKFNGKVNVKHFARALTDDFGLENLRSLVKNPFNGLTVAIHYGCHILRPSKYLDIEDPEEPSFLKELIEVTGIKTVEYAERRLCCGAPVLAVNEGISNRLVGVKLLNVKNTEANIMMTTCPFCFVNYNRNQPAAEETFGEKFDIPVVHFTQLLGLALGLQDVDLELSESCSDPEFLLKFLK